jgi:hypothetical protein
MRPEKVSEIAASKALAEYFEALRNHDQGGESIVYQQKGSFTRVRPGMASLNSPVSEHPLNMNPIAS